MSSPPRGFPASSAGIGQARQHRITQGGSGDWQVLGIDQDVAFVYDWRAETDDVEVALCNAEFVEKGGTSLSGSFISPEQIIREASGGEIEAEWSLAILNDLLPKAAQ